MSEKEKLLETLVEKSGKSKDDISKMISNKVDELSGLVSEEGAIYIVANDLGVRLEGDRPKREAELLKIDKITEPKTPVSLVCKVIRKYDRVTFSTNSGSEGSVQSLLTGDETGVTRVVFWNDKTELVENIHEGDVLKIINAYTRENNNNERIEVHFGQYSDIEVNPEGVKIELKEFTPTNIEFSEKKIDELEENDRNVSLKGIVTDFDIPRFYLGCPECFKKVFQDEGTYKCAQHEEVQARRIPIVNLILDDGSSTITVVGFRDRAEELTKLKTENILSLAENIDDYRNFSKKIIGAKLEIGGNVSISTMTGDKQILANQVILIEIEDSEPAKSSKKVEENKKEEKPVNEESKKKKADDELDIDDEDLEIEEIDFDDDLL